MRLGRADVLLFREQWNVRVADLEWTSEKVPAFRDLRTSTGVVYTLGVCWSGKRAVYDTPFTIDNDCVPGVVRASDALQVETFSRSLQVATYDLSVESNRCTHFSDHHTHF